MRIICPYTPNRLAKRTRDALPATTEFVKMTDFDSYQLLFLSLWKAGESFIIVEHDVVPSPGSLDRLARCKHQWCGCPYGPGGISLGCTKIADTLIAKLPKLWEKMPLRHWQYCDDWFGSHAEKVASQHRHEPVEAHLHKDNPIAPSRPLITRIRRETDQEIEVAFYDPNIEYEFGAVTLSFSQYSKERIKSHIASELDRLNRQYFPHTTLISHK